MDKVLHVDGVAIEKRQLKSKLENFALMYELTNKSSKETYPIPRMLENYELIREVYNLLNKQIKQEISIHPAGEWLLDNYYIIEKIVKQIKKDLNLKKYQNFIGIKSGQYKGYARIYVLAAQIVAYTDNQIKREDLEEYLLVYQSKKYLNMEEIWNIGLFLQIAIIENIRQICEKILSSQMQKNTAKQIVTKYMEEEKNTNKKEENSLSQNIKKYLNYNSVDYSKYSFIEYLSYSLKKYGRKSVGYLQALEEILEIKGTTVSDIIRKEHFDVAVKKVSIGNSIISLKEIQRINFSEIFEKVNGVEEILRQDPEQVYEKMDFKTKEYYRTVLKEIGTKTKISEIYIAKKTVSLAEKSQEEKKRHIGYYLIDKGKNELYKELGVKIKEIDEKTKTKIYISAIFLMSIIFSILTQYFLGKSENIFINILKTIILIIPISEIVIQILQYILGKVVKPKLIPKIDFAGGLDEENSTMVIIPTIVKNKRKVRELFRKIEVYYLANKSKNLYFTLLGDCSQSSLEDEDFDQDIIEEGLRQVKKLNNKYKNIFNFVYRKRTWNAKESCYLGWERKRGYINQFNQFLLGKNVEDFKINTIENPPKIKYIITLDQDTDLPIGRVYELVGAMAHILNKPKVTNKVVTEGYGIIQPRVGAKLNISYKNLFTKIYAANGGCDLYANAICDVYHDNFGEGIFTGKGIYDLNVFEEVMCNSIPENTVLSHDLLEGCYLRAGLASDILLLDDYPTKYMSQTNRLERWIRGDWQIISWIKNKNLNTLSKFKIFDNLRRSLLEILVLLCLIIFIKNKAIFTIALISKIIPNLIDLINYIIFKKDGEKFQKTFTHKIGNTKGAIYRALLDIGTLPYKAYFSLRAIVKTLYRMAFSHKHLLEWTTSEEAEKMSKTDYISYYKNMISNVIFAILLGIVAINFKSIYYFLVACLWVITPAVMCFISKEPKKKDINIKLEEKEYITEIARRTWEFFKDYLTKENNYLMTDNYQEGRMPTAVNRTSSTNIGLSLMAVMSAKDMKFINFNEAIDLIDKITETIEELPKWNGHLYNWYNIKTKAPLMPRYISTVDSGNFVGYLYVTKGFLKTTLEKYEDCKKIKKENKKYILKNKKTKKESIILKIKIIEKRLTRLINNTDFSVLYSKEQRLFSIGFNIEENRLTDSYYDLLASEARQASLVAIAKKDVPEKHWANLSRTMTELNKYKGLISWSGTAFEYLMPNINIPVFEGGLIDESCKFMLMSQIEYAKKLGINWGISEAAFNLKDLQTNYQYKAFGIPWLGLKRGLADDMVVSTYGSVLAITLNPKEVIKNLKELEKYGMYNKYGFYESIDFTPQRLSKGQKSQAVKTYMAHHQALILLSINNLLNKNILQKRFMKNPEIEGIEVLLQERMPETFITTKEKKEKVEKIKYMDYEDYTEKVYNKVSANVVRGNIISNNNYTIAFDQRGRGFSKFNDIYINRFKKTSDEAQGIFFYIKNIKTNKIWSTNYSNSNNNYLVKFMPDKIKQEMVIDDVKTTMTVTTASNKPVEIRSLELYNYTSEEQTFEVVSYFEPILSSKEQDYAHQAFNNLFLTTEFDENSKSLIVKRKKRGKNEKEIFLATTLTTNSEKIGEIEYEIDKEKFVGRGNIGVPKIIKQSIPFSKKLGLVTEPVLAMKTIIKVKPEKKANINLIISAAFEKETAISNLEEYSNCDTQRIVEISKARCEAENRYLSIKGKEIELYQKMLSYIIFDNPIKQRWMKELPKTQYKQSDLWQFGISGDFPIITVKIKDVSEIDNIKQILKAYEFFRMKNIQTEIVILNQEKYSYENYVKEEIDKTIANFNISYMKNVRGGIFVISESETQRDLVDLIQFVSDIVIDSNQGTIVTSINEMEEEELGGIQ